MHLEEALKLALETQKKYPQLLLGGSVALILAGRIAPREVKDVDFAVGPERTNDLNDDIEYRTTGNSQYAEKRDAFGNFCCYLKSEPKVNVFLAKKTPESGPRIAGLELQDIEQIIKYKLSYKRPRDATELGVIIKV